MTINREWHLKNKMPKNPTLEERVTWHKGHSQNCTCHPEKLPNKLAEEIKKQRLK